jgi:hypothetical protein
MSLRAAASLHPRARKVFDLFADDVDTAIVRGVELFTVYPPISPDLPVARRERARTSRQLFLSKAPVP